MPVTLTAARVAVVSGKGGVGKTTVAASLAIAAARANKHVLLAEVENRESFAPLFGLERLAYTERPLTRNINGISIEADESLVDYLRVVYGIPKISRALIRSKAVEFATNTAPGLRDILLIGKIMEAERRRHAGQHVYDLIVVDAPPTGRLPRFLDAPRAVSELVRGGPIKPQADKVFDMVTDPKRLHVVLVTTPEEMPAAETVEAVENLTKMGVAVGPLVVNGVWSEIRALGRDPVETLRAGAGASGLDLSAGALEQLASVAAAHAKRARNQRAVIKDLRGELTLPQIELPYLFTERIGRPELTRLAEMLAGSGSL